MIIFFQKIIMLLFLWLLRMIDGIMELFSAIAGITDVTYNGQRVNIIEFLVGDSTVSTIFWCVFILAVGLSCIFAITAFVKNMLSGSRNLSGILGKFFLSFMGTVAMVAVVMLGILIANAILQLVSEIFQISNTTKISNMLFESCVGEWLNGYSVSEIDITTLKVRDIFGEYITTASGMWPYEWKLNGMVNPNNFMYLPAMIASISVIIALLIAVVNLAKRVYEIIFMYIVMPLSMSTIVLDDGARFKVWREIFITRIVIAYGSVFAVNVFVLLLPIISKISIPNVSNFANAMFLIFMIAGGAMLIPVGQVFFARLFGQPDDMRTGGGFIRTAFYGGRVAGAFAVSSLVKLWSGKKRQYSTVDEKKSSKKFTEENTNNNNTNTTETGEQRNENNTQENQG